MNCVHCGAHTHGTLAPDRRPLALCPPCYTSAYHTTATPAPAPPTSAETGDAKDQGGQAPF